MEFKWNFITNIFFFITAILVINIRRVIYKSFSIFVQTNRILNRVKNIIRMLHYLQLNTGLKY